MRGLAWTTHSLEEGHGRAQMSDTAKAARQVSLHALKISGQNGVTGIRLIHHHKQLENLAKYMKQVVLDVEQWETKWPLLLPWLPASRHFPDHGTRYTEWEAKQSVLLNKETAKRSREWRRLHFRERAGQEVTQKKGFRNLQRVPLMSLADYSHTHTG